MRHGLPVSAWLAASLAASAGCSTVFRSEDRTTGIGPRIGLDVAAGWQETGTGVDSNDVPVYSEGAQQWSHAPFCFSWGMQAGKLYVEPLVLLGSATGTVENGRLVGIADAQFEEYKGSAFGAGVRLRFGLTETKVRFGLDLVSFSFAGESSFTVDGFPNLTTPHDAETSQLRLGAVLEYDDPSYRPYLSVGLLFNSSTFESQTSPGNPVLIESRGSFGARIGVVVKRLFGGPLDFEVALGYYEGPLFKLGIGYRF
jgi:hypothetical protein